MDEESFPAIKSKKGTKVWRLSCGHYVQSIICNLCSICNKETIKEEKMEIPTIKSYLCWDCKFTWIGNIEANKESNGLRCHNCGSLNKIKSNNERNPIDSKLRHECFKRDNYRCVECGETNKETILHADHIISVTQGGTDELDNLQTLCQEFNLTKSKKTWKSKQEVEKCSGQ